VARVIRDQGAEAFWGEATAVLADFVAAIQAGTRSTWLSEHLSSEYPQDLEDVSVISDLLAGLVGQYATDAYECEACGRILLQRAPDDPSFVTFSPDVGGATHILMGRARQCLGPDVPLEPGVRDTEEGRR